MIEFYGGYQVYSESGVDLTQLRENLKHSVTERWLANSHNAKALEGMRPKRRSVSKEAMTQHWSPTLLDVKGLLGQLAEHKVEYIVIGGLAIIAHGSAYITHDLAICYARTPNNIAALAAAFVPIHPYLRGAPAGLPFRFDALTIRAGLNFTLITDMGDVDVLGEVKGLGGYDQVLAQSVEKVVFGRAVRVLGIDGLIANKKAVDRVKDRLHLLELEELKKLRDVVQES